jgi:hypothetical protein
MNDIDAPGGRFMIIFEISPFFLGLGKYSFAHP